MRVILQSSLEGPESEFDSIRDRFKEDQKVSGRVTYAIQEKGGQLKESLEGG